jgi:hypothetical protein
MCCCVIGCCVTSIRLTISQARLTLVSQSEKKNSYRSAQTITMNLMCVLKGLRTLVGIQKDAPEFVGEKAASKITSTIARLGKFNSIQFNFFQPIGNISISSAL